MLKTVDKVTKTIINDDNNEFSSPPHSFEDYDEDEEKQNENAINMRTCSTDIKITENEEISNDKYENGERIKMTIGTFKRFLINKQNAISASSIDNTPIDNSMTLKITSDSIIEECTSSTKINY